MRYVLCLWFLCMTLLQGAETLIDTLIEGDFSTKVIVDHSVGKDYAGFQTSQNKLVLLNIKTEPYDNLVLEAAIQTTSTMGRFESYDNSIYYAEILYDSQFFIYNYNITANYFMHTSTATLASTTDDAKAFSIKAALDLNLFETYIAYSQVADSTTDAISSFNGHSELLPTQALLNSTNYEPNTTSYALDINFEPFDNVTFGSRYVYIENDLKEVSYTGVYSSFLLAEISPGLNVQITYDQASLDESNKKVHLNLHDSF